MRAIVFISILTFFTNSSFGQCDKHIIDRKEIFQFINSLHSEDSLKIFFLSSSNHFRQIEEDLKIVFADTIFTKQDIDFFKTQINTCRNFKWTSNKVEGARIVSNRKLHRLYKNYKNWDRFHEECGKSILGYSVPIFTCDRSKLVFYRSTYCGALCGGGQISVFEKINGKWTYLKDYGYWIS